MVATQPRRLAYDDPRRLRELLDKSRTLAEAHGLPSVVVGLAGHEGDLLLPEMLAYLESALRVEDAIFPLTRERAVLFLADVDEARARAVIDRFVDGFRQRFPALDPPAITLGFYEIRPGHEAQLKEVLPSVFPPCNA